MTKSINIPAIPPFKLHLCTSNKQYKKLCRKAGFGYEPVSSDGYSLYAHNADTGKTYFVMVIRGKDLTKWQTCALISHEAYHIACRYWECIGETRPGEESTAYLVQYITQSVLEALPKKAR